eukprot:2848539-Pyramimonas_sp.AAC.1
MIGLTSGSRRAGERPTHLTLTHSRSYTPSVKIGRVKRKSTQTLRIKMRWTLDILTRRVEGPKMSGIRQDGLTRAEIGGPRADLGVTGPGLMKATVEIMK